MGGEKLIEIFHYKTQTWDLLEKILNPLSYILSGSHEQRTKGNQENYVPTNRDCK